VTLDEALTELGVGHDVDRVGARRAYLRGVKQHPPERDPSGFARLREAYELVQAYAEEPGLAVRELPGPAETPAEIADGTPPELPGPRQDLAEFELEFEGLREHNELEQMFAHLLETCGDLDDPQAPPPEPEALDAACEAGIRSCKQAGSAARDPGPPRYVLYQLILLCHRSNAAARARELTGALRAYLMRTGRELEIDSPEEKSIWLLIQELAELPGHFPAALRADLAWSIHQGDLALAFEATERHRLRHGMRSLRKLRAEIQLDAPEIARLMSGPSVDVEPQRDRTVGIGWIVFAAIQLVFVFNRIGSCQPGMESRALPERLPSRSAPFTQPEPALQSQLRGLCAKRAEDAAWRGPFCLGALSTLRQLEQGQCASAASALLQARVAVPPDADRAFATAVEGLDLAWRRRCDTPLGGFR